MAVLAATAEDHVSPAVTLRILPAYWTALVLLSLWPGTDGHVLGRDWWRFFLLAQNLSSETTTQGLIIVWSLCVEATFYVLVPLLAWAVQRAARRLGRPWWQAELAAVAAFGAVSPVALWMASAGSLPLWTANTLLTTSLWFAPGMALAIMSVGAERGGLRAGRIQAWMARWAGLLWVAATVAFLGSARIEWHYIQHPAHHLTVLFRLSLVLIIALEATFGGCLLAPIVAGATGRVRAIAGWRPLMLLGLVSYGVFLWHAVLVRWLSVSVGGTFRHFWPLAIATLALSIAIATVSYRVVELPFLRLKDPGRRLSASLRRR